MVPLARNAGLRFGILAGSTFSGCSSFSTSTHSGLVLHGDRRDFLLERAILNRVARAGQSFDGVVVPVLRLN